MEDFLNSRIRMKLCCMKDIYILFLCKIMHFYKNSYFSKTECDRTIPFLDSKFIMITLVLNIINIIIKSTVKQFN